MREAGSPRREGGWAPEEGDSGYWRGCRGGIRVRVKVRVRIRVRVRES